MSGEEYEVSAEFEQGRQEMIAQIAQADGYDPGSRTFWRGDVETTNDSYQWHGITSILFSEGAPSVPEWHMMDFETRQRLAGRMEVLADFIIAGSQADEERRRDVNSGEPGRLQRLFKVNNPIRLHKIMPKLFPAPPEDATIAMMNAERAIHGDRSPHEAGHRWGD